MQLTTQSDDNYYAEVVKLGPTYKLERCDNVVGTSIYGRNVIVGKDTAEGSVGVFFPVECSLDPEFMFNNNLYRDATFNKDQTVKGYFENHGRVKAVKFRGHASEGIWLPLTCLNYLGVADSLKVGDKFNAVSSGPAAVTICSKAVIGGKSRRQGKSDNRICEGQFAYHGSTKHLDRCEEEIAPLDYVYITDKWHGVSAILANVLCHRPKTKAEKFLSKIGIDLEKVLHYFQIPLLKTSYKYVWSSRRVIRGVSDSAPQGEQITNIWDKLASENVYKVPQGFIVYGEIVGFDEKGVCLQQTYKPELKKKVSYTYGCLPKQHLFVVYRVVQVSPGGVRTEYTWDQMSGFCRTYGFRTVTLLARGTPCDIVHGDDTAVSKLAKMLKEENNGRICSFNPEGTPAEGVVVRVDRENGSSFYKQKNFEFLRCESAAMDENIADVETTEG